MKHLVVLSGAGISAESGIATFRDSGGLWEGYEVTEVATPEAWDRDPKLVLDFYNMRRKVLYNSEPNSAHKTLVDLEDYFHVDIITQNIDNLHERAGSKNILHLHGELTKSQSSLDPDLVFDINGIELNLGELCPLGSQLRPHVVWFGESVPRMIDAVEIAQKADIFVVIGTSMAVYPAAALINYIPRGIPIFVVDPGSPQVDTNKVHFINEKASSGTLLLKEMLVNQLLI